MSTRFDRESARGRRRHSMEPGQSQDTRGIPEAGEFGDRLASAHGRVESSFSGTHDAGAMASIEGRGSFFGSASDAEPSRSLEDRPEKPRSMFARHVINAAKNRSSQSTQKRLSDRNVHSEASDSSGASPSTRNLTDRVDSAFSEDTSVPPLRNDSLPTPSWMNPSAPGEKEQLGYRPHDNEYGKKAEGHRGSIAAVEELVGSASPEKFSRELHRTLASSSWAEMHAILLLLQDQPNFIIPSLTLPGADHATVLHVSAWKAPPALTKFVVEAVAGPRGAQTACVARDSDGNTPLHLCAANLEEVVPGKLDVSVLKCLVKNGRQSLQMQNSQGDTPLHLLVSSPACSRKTAEFAIEAAAEAAVSVMLNASMEAAVLQDNTGATPLHVAVAAHAHERVLMCLLEGAPSAAQVEDERGMLPLHYLAASGCTSYSLMKLLVDSYPQGLHHATTNGDTPLHVLATNASSMLSEEARQDRNLSRLVELLASSVDDDEQGSTTSPLVMLNTDQLNPLHCCVLFDAPPALLSFIVGPQASEAVAMPNAFGATPLHMLCAHPNIGDLTAVVGALATRDAARTADRLKRTPLHVAAQNSRAPSQLIRELLHLCPEAASMRTQRGHLALHLAAQSQVRDSVVKALLRANPEAAQVRNKSENTPLHDASKYHASKNVVKLLLEAYPDAIFIQNQYGNLPLHCATAYRATPEVIELLLSAWPDSASMQNKSQDAPLHYAASQSTSAAIVQSLIDAAPAAVLLSNSNGQTPIDKAKENNVCNEILDILEESAYEWTKKASAEGWGSFSGDKV